MALGGGGGVGLWAEGARDRGGALGWGLRVGLGIGVGLWAEGRGGARGQDSISGLVNQ